MNPKNRRDFLKTGAAFSAAALVGTDSLFALAQNLSAPSTSEILTAASFEAALGKTLYLLTEEGQIGATFGTVTKLANSSIERLPKTYRHESFTVQLTYNGPSLPQGTYECTSVDLGRRALFLVPLPEPDANGNRILVATFNNLVKSGKLGRLVG
jgi:hypothetical protein